MRSSRETIYDAIFSAGKNATLVDGSLAFVTVSRRWRHFTQVGAEEMPAFFQVQRKERPQSHGKLGQPPFYELTLDWVIYVSSGASTDIVPSQLLNPIIDAVLATLPFSRMAGPIPDQQTLGVTGLVDVRIIDEEIVYNEGEDGTQAFAIIPVRAMAI